MNEKGEPASLEEGLATVYAEDYPDASDQEKRMIRRSYYTGVGAAMILMCKIMVRNDIKPGGQEILDAMLADMESSGQR